MAIRYRDLLTACRTAFRPSNEHAQDYAAALLRRHGYRDLVREPGLFTFARGPLPVVLVAHTDTVHRAPPARVFHDPRSGALWAPGGLGADDRAGLAAVDVLLAQGFRPSVLFTDEEETGGAGARAAARLLDPGAPRALLQFDRMNADDFVTYSCHCPALDRWCERHGFTWAPGSYTDIATLMPAWEVAGCNLSVGYYRQHCPDEYLLLRELRQTVRRAAGMLRDLPAEPFPYGERPAAPRAGRAAWLPWRQEDACGMCGEVLYSRLERQDGLCWDCWERLSADGAEDTVIEPPDVERTCGGRPAGRGGA